MTKPKEFTKSNPCPHCGKTDWCYSLGELSVCNRDRDPAPGWRRTKKFDSNGKPYYAPDTDQDSKPSIVKTTTYPYHDRDGRELVQVVRHDLSNGKKRIYQQGKMGNGWVSSLKHLNRSEISIYRYEAIKKAISDGELIFFVEGEGVADSLVALGLQASTNLRGSGGLTDSDLDDLDGADLIICPDRDTKGMAWANKIAKRYPSAKWLYAFPESSLWRQLPEDNGADLKNWIEDYNLTAADLVGAIEDRREAIDSTAKKLEVLGFTQIDYQKLEQVREAVDNLIDSKVTESDKVAKLMALSELFRWDYHKVSTYYQLRQRELEQDETKEETQREIDSILESMDDDIDLDGFIHPYFIESLNKLSDKLRYKRVSALTAVLTAVSVLHKVGTVLLLEDDFAVSPNLCSLLVSPSGQGKSPLMKATIAYPFDEIEKEFIAEHEQTWENYELRSAEFNLMSKDEQRLSLQREGILKRPPEAPRMLYATDMNTIALAKQFRMYPEQGFLGLFDEAKKLFNFKAGGRADDESNLLSLYDGFGIKELRAGETRATVAATLFGLYGLIQPRVLLSLMGDDGDEQGRWARFLFTFQAKEPKTYDLRYGKEKSLLSKDLASLYRSILKLPQRAYKLTPGSQEMISIYLTQHTERERMANSDNILEKFYGKSASRLAKLILNLHVLQGSQEMQNEIVDDLTVLKGIELDDFYSRQIRILHSKSRAQRGELAPKLVEILRLAKQNNVPTTARDITRNSWVFRKDKDTSDQIRQYFQQLEEMGKGCVCRCRA